MNKLFNVIKKLSLSGKPQKTNIRYMFLWMKSINITSVQFCATFNLQQSFTKNLMVARTSIFMEFVLSVIELNLNYYSFSCLKDTFLL